MLGRMPPRTTVVCLLSSDQQIEGVLLALRHPIGKILNERADHEAVLVTTEHRLQLLHPLGQRAGGRP